MSTDKNLKHKLKNRHLQMIALGGAIGTGLFFGSAKSIHLTGPSIVLAYIIGGLIMFIILRALGEMTLHNPCPGSFSRYAHDYLGEYGGFIVGWNAWFQYTIVCMVELSAIAFFFDYWFIGIPHWILCFILLILFTIINLLSIKVFGEFEFYFTGIKISAIVLMLAFSVYLIFFKHEFNPNLHQYSNPNLFFIGGFKGFIISFVIVIFAFGGSEFVCIAAGEAENPKRDIPRAINGVIIRILLFYVLTMLAIICLYPYEKLSTNISPFVDVFQKIGIPVAAQIMNIVAITAALSSFNSCLYSSSRILYSISLQNNASKYLSNVSKTGIPFASVLFTSFVILITVIMNYLFPDKALMYLLTITTGAILITWFMILITQISFRRKHKHDNLKFRLRLYPFSSIFAIIMLIT
ncbi:MAG: amino acid permease, partial [Neisseriaceae bacterium]